MDSSYHVFIGSVDDSQSDNSHESCMPTQRELAKIHRGVLERMLVQLAGETSLACDSETATKLGRSDKEEASPSSPSSPSSPPDLQTLTVLYNELKLKTPHSISKAIAYVKHVRGVAWCRTKLTESLSPTLATLLKTFYVKHMFLNKGAHRPSPIHTLALASIERDAEALCKNAALLWNAVKAARMRERAREQAQRHLHELDEEDMSETTHTWCVTDLCSTSKPRLSQPPQLPHVHIKPSLSPVIAKVANKLDEDAETANLPYPQAMICALTHQPMVDPVLASDGCTYERDALMQWFVHSKQSVQVLSPLTRQPMDERAFPNRALLRLIEEHTARVQAELVKRKRKRESDVMDVIV
jgi:hypothetical protein